VAQASRLCYLYFTDYTLNPLQGRNLVRPFGFDTSSPYRSIKTLSMTRLPRQLEDLAKVLTYVLCHRPDEFGLVLDAEGFVSVKQLLQALAAEGGFSHARRHHLEQLAGLLQPPRFELAGDKIRGLVPGPADLRRPGEAPPTLLYLAISPKAHERVFEAGLMAPAGQELLLAYTRELALKLGRRRSPDPILVTVQAEKAARAGVALVAYGEDLSLAREIPRQFLQLAPPPVKQPEKPKPEKAPPPRPLPGTVLMDLPDFLAKPARPRNKDKKGEPAWKSGTRALRRERRKREK
jgi:putative RNA 2'-phosphotransferase